MEVETEGICAICQSTAVEVNDADQETFSRFCSDILNVPVNDGDNGDGGLPRLSSGFSVCKECLILLKKAVECRDLTNDVEARVKHLQLQMLAELRELKRRMEWFYLDVEIIAEIVNRSRVQKGDGHVSMLRGEILKASTSLATYTTKLSRKLLIPDSDDGEESDEEMPDFIPVNMRVNVKMEACDPEPNESLENLTVPDVEVAAASSSSSSPSKKKRRRGNKSLWYRKKKASETIGEQHRRRVVNACKTNLQSRNMTGSIKRKLAKKSVKTGSRFSLRSLSHSSEVLATMSAKGPNEPDSDIVRKLKRTVPGPKKCKKCDFVYTSLKGLRIHMREHTEGQKLYRGADEPPPLTVQVIPGSSNVEPGTSTQVKVNKRRSDKKMHKCHLCNYCCRTPLTLQQHVKLHTQDGKPFKCRQCNCYFSTEVALISHKDYRHKNVKWKVRIIRDNIEVVESKDKKTKKRFRCKICGKTFSQRNNTNFHIQTVHWNHRPFACPEPNCTKVFARKNGLENHKFAHLGLKPEYVCPVCDAKFIRLFAMQNHVKQRHPGTAVEGDEDEVAGGSGNTD